MSEATIVIKVHEEMQFCEIYLDGDGLALETARDMLEIAKESGAFGDQEQAYLN